MVFRCALKLFSKDLMLGNVPKIRIFEFLSIKGSNG